jgi:2-iminobutanoate/2-iminopropanoate deaminase
MSKRCILYKINDTMKRIIASPLAPKAVGPYSQAVEAGSTLYISGQLPIDASTGKMPETIEEQTRQALTNLGYIAAEAGYTLADAVKVSVLLDDIADFAAMNGVYATFFTENMPARVCYEVAKLPMGAKVEIDAILCK